MKAESGREVVAELCALATILGQEDQRTLKLEERLSELFDDQRPLKGQALVRDLKLALAELQAPLPVLDQHVSGPFLANYRKTQRDERRLPVLADKLCQKSAMRR
jgi:hypothetical protein